MKTLKQKGFTLIELLIVIVILGILSVAIAPKFFDFSSDARKATRDGVVGALQSAMTLGKARASFNGVTDGEITAEGAVINVSNGYPSVKADASANGTATKAYNIVGMLDLNGIDADATAENAATTTMTFTIASDCTVTYTDATSSAAPEIGGVTTGC